MIRIKKIVDKNFLSNLLYSAIKITEVIKIIDIIKVVDWKINNEKKNIKIKIKFNNENFFKSQNIFNNSDEIATIA